MKDAEQTAKTFWDSGSNRCIVREEFAEKNNLPSQTVTYTIEAVGGKEEQVTGKIYKFDLVDRLGVSHPIWAYGYAFIMTYEAPDVRVLMRKLPHVPRKAFLSVETGEVDILMGLNFNHLFPEGGTGCDKVGGIRALRSLFDCGWMVGGCDKSIMQEGTSVTVNPAVARLKCARVDVKVTPGLTTG